MVAENLVHTLANKRIFVSTLENLTLWQLANFCCNRAGKRSGYLVR